MKGSLRRRLMTAFVGLVAGVLVIAGAGSIILTHNAARKQATQQLVTEAQSLTAGASAHPAPRRAEHGASGLAPGGCPSRPSERPRGGDLPPSSGSDIGAIWIRKPSCPGTRCRDATATSCSRPPR